MATVINEVTLEPKAMPPGDPAAKSAGGGQGGQVPPDMQREIEKLAHLSRERAARLFAY